MAEPDTRNLSPAEAAKRLGVSIKALRLYERHGLVAPTRSAADWRAYGPDQMTRLHKVLALKALGLPLARISQILSAREVALDEILALQEQTLLAQQSDVGRALSSVRAARARLSAGETLTVDDLATLTLETTMSSKPDQEKMKEIFDPIIAKHFSAKEIAETARRPFDQEKVGQDWDRLIEEAKALMAKGDPASPAALDLARRWKAQVDLFTRGDDAMAARVKTVWNEAMADPKTAPALPLNPEIFAFVGKAMARLNEENR